MKNVNFHFCEFVESKTAESLGIKNLPNWTEIENIRLLCSSIIQPVRDYIAHPMYINSGFRVPLLNIALGGSATSSHMTGRACDFTFYDKKLNYEAFMYIKSMDFYDQVILHEKFVHVGFREDGNRRMSWFDDDYKPIV